MIVNGTRLLSTEFSRLLKRRCQKLCSVFNKWVWIVSSQPWRAPLLWLTSSRFSASILRKKFHLLYILWESYSKTKYINVSILRSGKIGLLEINTKYKSSHYWNSENNIRRNFAMVSYYWKTRLRWPYKKKDP